MDTSFSFSSLKMIRNGCWYFVNGVGGFLISSWLWGCRGDGSIACNVCGHREVVSF